LVVAFGLGNPGQRYDLTRHNAGVEVITLLRRSLELPSTPGRGDFAYALDAARDLYLVAPTTYVNTCGESVIEALNQFGADPDALIVVCDDYSLPLGSIRIRKKGGDGGHNGLASIIYQLASEEFPRLRLGIGPLPPETDPRDFVLSRFTGDELAKVEQLKKAAAEAILEIADSGLDRAMNTYNRRVGE
jgi:PTH1 family peptidyl-tRNA hydrolase